MANPLPFLESPGDTQLRALLAALNDPSFLTRTVAVNLDDNTVDARGFPGLTATDSLGAVPPEYICGSITPTATGTAAVAKDTIKFVPFVHPHGFRISQIAFGVQTGGAAGSVARVGIYDCIDDLRGDMTPNRLLLDGGEFDTTATGQMATAVTTQLEEGRWYWAAYHCGVNAPTIPTIALGGQALMLGSASGASPTHSTHLTVNQSYGALPVTAPSGAIVQTAVSPAIFLTFTRYTTTKRTRTVPLYSPASNGFSLRGVRLLRGTTLLPDNGTGRPYAILKAQTRTSSGSHTLGTFDTRMNKMTAGSPYNLTGGITDIPLAKNQEVVMVCEQYGWPKVSLKDTTALVDVIYTGGA